MEITFTRRSVRLICLATEWFYSWYEPRGISGFLLWFVKYLPIGSMHKAKLISCICERVH